MSAHPGEDEPGCQETYAAMARRRTKNHIDEILRDWPHEPGEVAARIVKGQDGRPLLQLRIDLGLLQMETEGRPDGSRPGGHTTYYEHMTRQAAQHGDQFTLTNEDCGEIDREFVQFYHRRTCWLALREFRKAVGDADHTLALMDFTRRHSDDREWTLSHEQYRPFVLFHRTQAKALAELEDAGPDEAIESINDGLEQLRRLFIEYDAEEHYDDDDLVRKLIELRESIREHYHVGQTLTEKLAEAVAAERYEEAARLRDELERRRAPQE
ncbi:MAG: UvrB/UvrC motif-containing protein [Pirellulales bacterium]